MLSGGKPEPHKIHGIGAGFVPNVLDRSVFDEFITVSNETALATARKCAKLEGVKVGISSDATIAAALVVGKRPEMKGKQIVLVTASSAERCLSTDLFAE